MLIPQGIAYAMLAGLPPIYGLYAALIPLILYPLFGTSKQLSVGPVATISVLVLASLSQFAEPNSHEYIQLVILVSFLSGVIQMLFSFFKLGFMVKFLSDPVLTGFTAAVAIIIALGQLPNLMGVEAAQTGNTIQMIENIFWYIPKSNMLALLIGGGSLIFLMVMKKVWRSFPSALLLLLVGIPLVYYFRLDQEGLRIIGSVPSGLPKFDLPAFSFRHLETVFSTSLIIALLSFIESLAIAKSISAKHDNYPIDPDKELFSLGFSKVVGSFFQGYPTTGSFSRSAVNDQAGTKTGVASMITAVMISLTLLFLAEFIYYLPKAILAAIVLSAVVGLLEIGKAKFYYKTSRHDFWVMLVTFFGTLLFGIQNGVIIGILLSVGYLLYRVSQAPHTVLGCLETGNGLVFRNVKRFNQAKERNDLLIIRFDAPIYFFNAQHFKEIIWEEIKKRPENPIYLTLDFSSVNNIDATGLQVFEQIVDEVQTADIQLILTNVQGRVRDRLDLAGLMAKVGPENQFLINKDAYSFTANPHNRNLEKMKYATQTKKEN